MPSHLPTRARRSPARASTREWPRAAVRRLGDVLARRSPSAALTRFIARTTAASRVTRGLDLCRWPGRCGRRQRRGRPRARLRVRREIASLHTRSAVPACASLPRTGEERCLALVATTSGRRRDRSPACCRSGSSRPALALAFDLGVLPVRRCASRLVPFEPVGLLDGVCAFVAWALRGAAGAFRAAPSSCSHACVPLTALPSRSCLRTCGLARHGAVVRLRGLLRRGRARLLRLSRRFGLPARDSVPGTVTPRARPARDAGPAWSRPGGSSAGDFASWDAPVTATPPATLTAATAAAALIATPPAKRPPPVAVAAPAPVPTPAAIEPAPPAATGSESARAVPFPHRRGP